MGLSLKVLSYLATWVSNWVLVTNTSWKMTLRYVTKCRVYAVYVALAFYTRICNWRLSSQSCFACQCSRTEYAIGPCNTTICTLRVIATRRRNPPLTLSSRLLWSKTKFSISKLKTNNTAILERGLRNEEVYWATFVGMPKRISEIHKNDLNDTL